MKWQRHGHSLSGLGKFPRISWGAQFLKRISATAATPWLSLQIAKIFLFVCFFLLKSSIQRGRISSPELVVPVSWCPLRLLPARTPPLPKAGSAPLKLERRCGNGSMCYIALFQLKHKKSFGQPHLPYHTYTQGKVFQQKLCQGTALSPPAHEAGDLGCLVLGSITA